MNRVDNTTGAAASKDRPLAGDNAPIRGEPQLHFEASCSVLA